MNEKLKLMTEVMMLAVKMHTETEYCVFLRMSGHVNTMEIEIRESKDNWKEEVADCKFYIDQDGTVERIKEVKEKLIKFIGENNVDLEELDTYTQEITHYTF